MTAPRKPCTRTTNALGFSYRLRDRKILAHRAVNIHGKSRAQVLESGGRVDKGITSEARSLDGTDDSGCEVAHRARSETGADCGGLKLSVGRASNPGCRGYEVPSIPVRER